MTLVYIVVSLYNGVIDLDDILDVCSSRFEAERLIQYEFATCIKDMQKSCILNNSSAVENWYLPDYHLVWNTDRSRAVCDEYAGIEWAVLEKDMRV
jgi:hypothetical protein